MGRRLQSHVREGRSRPEKMQLQDVAGTFLLVSSTRRRGSVGWESL